MRRSSNRTPFCPYRMFPDEFMRFRYCLEKLRLMSLRKVYGGTPVGTESRCDTCTHARIIQGYAESERIVLCTKRYIPLRIPFNVSQCTDYEDRRLPDFENMEEIAWQIRTKSAGSVAGFVTVPEENDSPKQEKESG